MKIGILGSGDVGKALAKGFLKHGYEVMIATSKEGKLKEFADENDVKVGSFDETSKFSEIAVLCVKGTAAENVVEEVSDNLDGTATSGRSSPWPRTPRR